MRRKDHARFLTALSIATFLAGVSLAAESRPRIVITTDPELDDSNSLIRFLLYSTDFKIEGLIYASSGVHWKGDGKGTKWSIPGREYKRFGLNLCPCTSWRWAEGERYIDDAVETYEKVYPNLKVHNKNYPSPADLKSKIRVGNIEFDGDISKDTPGSDLIKSLILDQQSGPLYLSAWGGHSTIARALKSIQEQYQSTPQWPALQARISNKVVLLPSGDQDDTYATYIKPNWPEIEFFQLTGAGRFGYGARNGATPADLEVLSAAWTKENVSSRGPFGAFYRVWGDGKQMVKDDIFDYFGMSGFTSEQLKSMGYIVWTPVQEKGSWIGEGDTPTFMNLLDNGLREDGSRTYGGWGGRKRTTASAPPSANSPFAALEATFRNPSAQTPGSGAQASAAVPAEPDFFPAAQRDFAARLKWSVTPTYKGANHEPRVFVKRPSNIVARPGQAVQLRGRVSDPDHNNVAVKWWQYGSTGSYPGQVTITNPNSLAAELQVPRDAVPGQTIRIILEATDDGTPALTRYQRVVVLVAQ